MELIKIIGWILTGLPLLSFLGLFIWMVKEIINEEESIKYFLYIMFLVLFLGILLLAVAYLGELFL